MVGRTGGTEWQRHKGTKSYKGKEIVESLIAHVLKEHGTLKKIYFHLQFLKDEARSANIIK